MKLFSPQMPSIPVLIGGITLTFLVLLYALRFLLMIPQARVTMRERRRVDAFEPIEDEGPSRSGRVSAAETIPTDNPYAPPRAGSEKVSATEYMGSRSAAAESLGFRFLGAFRDAKGERYQVRYDMWLSPDREILAIVGAGKIGANAIRATTLVSHVGGGRTLTTVDKVLAETDLSGLSDWRSAKGADFDEQLDAHRRWLTEDSPTGVVPFSESDPLADYREIRVGRVERLRALGFARSLDDRGDAWKYTAKGAIAFAYASQRKMAKEMRINMEARKQAARTGTTVAAALPAASPWLDRANAVCMILLLSNLVLTVTRRGPSSPSWTAVRIILIAIGLGGSMAIQGIKSARARRRAATS